MLHSLFSFLVMYCLLAIPALVYAILKMVDARRDQGKYLRCDHCGHSGRMKSVLANRDVAYAAFFLLLLGVIPGVVFISWFSRKYPCRRCGKVSRHLPSSASLSQHR